MSSVILVILVIIPELSPVIEPTTVTEGRRVRLTCRNGCTSSPQRNAVWFRDGQPVTNPDFQARVQDAGSYHCAVRGQETVRSDSVALNVQYLPQNISVSVDPPGPVAEGSSVNLTCTSAANPAVDSYTWYRWTGSPSSLVQVGSGQVLSLPSLEPSQTGLYFCQARNPLGENNSTEIRLEMDMTENEHGEGNKQDSNA
ncbi:B-cell receptor CD22-like [Diretmus argenteus]